MPLPTKDEVLETHVQETKHQHGRPENVLNVERNVSFGALKDVFLLVFKALKGSFWMCLVVLLRMCFSFLFISVVVIFVPF